MQNEVVQQGHIQFVGNMLLIEEWKLLIQPLLGFGDVCFHCGDHDFVSQVCVFHSQAPGLLSNKIL